MKWLWPLICALLLPATVAATLHPPDDMGPIHAILFFCWISVNGALAGFGLDNL